MQGEVAGMAIGEGGRWTGLRRREEMQTREKGTLAAPEGLSLGDF